MLNDLQIEIHNLKSSIGDGNFLIYLKASKYNHLPVLKEGSL
ncbi:hypothetical protein EV144_101863 [Flavobacterium sp. 270]|nr:hypothetical protein EV145_106102 [Flavobacterium sp. 245]TDW52178.1 hypothetical protein EV144_101863 [Flavobacterium sp. 270]